MRTVLVRKRVLFSLIFFCSLILSAMARAQIQQAIPTNTPEECRGHWLQVGDPCQRGDSSSDKYLSCNVCCYEGCVDCIGEEKRLPLLR